MAMTKAEALARCYNNGDFMRRSRLVPVADPTVLPDGTDMTIYAGRCCRRRNETNAELVARLMRSARKYCPDITAAVARVAWEAYNTGKLAQRTAQKNLLEFDTEDGPEVSDLEKLIAEMKAGSEIEWNMTEDDWCTKTIIAYVKESPAAFFEELLKHDAL